MNTRAVRTTGWALMTAATLAAAPVVPPAEKQAAGATDAVTRLSDESYAVREAATHELWKLGEEALPELRKAAEGIDPEAAIRARDLLRKIELGILPDSSPKIVELVLRYDRGGIEDRRNVVGELRRQRAWRQILKLYALEKDPDSLSMLEGLVRGVAADAARDCLAMEPADVRGAFAFLKMARPGPAEYMAMAALHRANGTLEEEIGKARELDSETAHLWRYALFSAAGRTAEAAAEAEQAGEQVAAMRLHLLAGDPVPWLRDSAPSPQSIPALGLAGYREFAIRSWEGKPVKPDMIRQFRRLAKSGDDEERAKALRLLFLVGDHAEAEKMLVALDPGAAFHYFESSERVEEALKAFGLDPEKPDYKAWASKRFRVLIDHRDREESEITELSLLGYFLERRGLVEELDEAFVGPLVELGKADQETFIRTAARLFAGSYEALSTPTVRPVIKACALYSGDDEVRWMQVVENLFDGQEDPDRIWNWLAVVEPGLEKEERLELLCRIFGLLPDPADQRGKFFDKAWAAFAKVEEKERRALAELMTDLADSTRDSANFLKGIDEIMKLEPEAAGQRFKGYHHAGLGRWSDAAAEWMRLVKLYPGDPAYRASAASSYRRAGDEEAAREQERLAEVLALGETAGQLQCGDAFALTGDFKRASVWWRRAAVECTQQTSIFPLVLFRLNDQAYTDEDWQLAAALGEAQALQQAMAGSEAYRIPVTFDLSRSLRMRIDADFSRAFARLEKDRAGSTAEIERCAAMPFADLTLADRFFAPMRAAGLVKQHDQAFERLWENLVKRIERFPKGDNTRNSAAWLASRASRRLEEAEKYLEKALESYPRQAAYLDTMAEVQFAMGNREKAVRFSERAVIEEPSDLRGPRDFQLQLIRQHERFKSGPFPPK